MEPSWSAAKIFAHRAALVTYPNTALRKNIEGNKAEIIGFRHENRADGGYGFDLIQITEINLLGKTSEVITTFSGRNDSKNFE